MNTKKMMDFLTMSANMYLLANDEDFKRHMQQLREKGMEAMVEFMSAFPNGEALTKAMSDKAAEMREEFTERLDSAVKAAYDKMQIAHAERVTALEEELKVLKNELALTEAKLIHLETRLK
jgi:hypothetical protein